MTDFKLYTVKSNARRDMRKHGVEMCSHDWHEETVDGRKMCRPVFSMLDPEDVEHFHGLGFDARLRA